ncbi:hypothetical protein [Streptomyces sp. NPDC019507]|uniref:hypothetical protein n=1 Tax=Streptomyces sp. NPDC019507 TaxID=3154689 RepID=UPI0033E67D69
MGEAVPGGYVNTGAGDRSEVLGRCADQRGKFGFVVPGAWPTHVQHFLSVACGSPPQQSGNVLESVVVSVALPPPYITPAASSAGEYLIEPVKTRRTGVS